MRKSISVGRGQRRPPDWWACGTKIYADQIPPKLWVSRFLKVDRRREKVSIYAAYSIVTVKVESIGVSGVRDKTSVPVSARVFGGWQGKIRQMSETPP